MVSKRHPEAGEPAGTAAVPLYGFRPPVGTPYGLEVNTIEEFFAHHDDWPWNPPLPGRATFHYLIALGCRLLEVQASWDRPAPGVRRRSS